MSIILNQGKEGECAGFAILGALLIMKPDIDYTRIAQELIDEKGNEFTLMRASKWFIKKGYIKDFKECKYSQFILRKKPIITGLTDGDWQKANISPYVLEYKKRDKSVGHYFIIVAPGKIKNSWGSKWGDNGYCYFKTDLTKKMKQMYTLTI